MKTKIINGVLWVAFVLAMVASIQHLASTFATAERAGSEWLGWVPAVAVDAGLAALAYTIQQRKKVGRPTAILWGGVVGFALISALANLYHALAIEAVANAAIASFLESWGVLIAKALLLSATLPAMYIFLGEIVSGDDAAAAADAATAAAKAIAKAEREQRREDLKAERETLEAKRLLLDAENERERLALQQAQAAQPVARSENSGATCPVCLRSFRSVNAMNAHKCKGAPAQSEIISLEAEAVPLNGQAHDV